MRWVLVEATGRILPEVGEDLGEYTVDELLQARASTCGCDTRLESCVDGHVVLSDGEEFDAETIVWTAGVQGQPDARADRSAARREGPAQVPAGPAGRGRRRGLGAGDGAAVPDLTGPPGALTRPERAARGAAGQAARRQPGPGPQRSLAELLRHKYVGSVASLGLYKGVAQVYGIKLRGFPAWFMHRTYHVSRVPTLNRKVRVVLDWTLALFFRREIVSLGSLQHPREEFSEAAR